MNDLSTNDSTTIAGLPIPPKEKVARWLSHGAIVALGVAGVITFMPFINKALTLLVNGVWSLTELVLAGAAAFAVSLAVLKLAPVYRRFIESCANKATWAVFEYDPTTPLELWLKEVRHDRVTVETEYMNCEGVISTNQQMEADNLKRAEKGDKLFAAAVKQYGEDSNEARLQALEPGRLRQTAENIHERIEPLLTMRDILKEVVDASVFTERAAELEVEGLKQEFLVAKSTERAQDSAERAIGGRSQRRQNAMMCAKIIHDKYATQFGRLRGFRELSRELLTSVDLEKGTFHQEALERLKVESRFITGAKKPELLEAQLTGQAQGVSFYKVATPVRSGRK